MHFKEDDFVCKGCDPEVPSNTPSLNPVPSLNMPSSEVAPTSKAPSSKAASPAPLHEVDLDMLDSSALIRDEADHKYLYSLSELNKRLSFIDSSSYLRVTKIQKEL